MTCDSSILGSTRRAFGRAHERGQFRLRSGGGLSDSPEPMNEVRRLRSGGFRNPCDGWREILPMRRLCGCSFVRCPLTFPTHRIILRVTFMSLTLFANHGLNRQQHVFGSLQTSVDVICQVRDDGVSHSPWH